MAIAVRAEEGARSKAVAERGEFAGAVVGGPSSGPEAAQRAEWAGDLEAALASTAGSDGAYRAIIGWSQRVARVGAEASDIEKGLEQGGRELLRRALQEAFDERGNGDVGPAVERLVDEVEGVRLSERRERPWVYLSRFGPVTVGRMGYGASGESTLYPISESLNLPRRHHSFPVQKQVAILSARGPFGEVADELGRTTARGVGKRQVEEIAVDAAIDFDTFYEEATERLPPAEQTGEVIVSGLDCKGIPRRKTEAEKASARAAPDAKHPGKGKKRKTKKMATVASVHTTERHLRTPEEVAAALMDAGAPVPGGSRPKAEHHRVFASIKKPKDEIIAETAAEMKRRDPDGTKTAVCVVDGEKALHRRIAKYIGALFPRLFVVLDIIHVLGYLWDAAHVFCEEGSEEARQWVRARLLRILRGQVSYVAAGMRQSATKLGLSEAERKPVDTAARYFLNNKHMMRYDDYLRLGLPIASGVAEGACGHLVRDRMEITGALWDLELDRAEAVLRLRALDKSGDFDRYWDFHMKKERQRNYADQWAAAA